MRCLLKSYSQKREDFDNFIDDTENPFHNKNSQELATSSQKDALIGVEDDDLDLETGSIRTNSALRAKFREKVEIEVRSKQYGEAMREVDYDDLTHQYKIELATGKNETKFMRIFKTSDQLLSLRHDIESHEKSEWRVLNAFGLILGGVFIFLVVQYADNFERINQRVFPAYNLVLKVAWRSRRPENWLKVVKALEEYIEVDKEDELDNCYAYYLILEALGKILQRSQNGEIVGGVGQKDLERIVECARYSAERIAGKIEFYKKFLNFQDFVDIVSILLRVRVLRGGALDQAYGVFRQVGEKQDLEGGLSDRYKISVLLTFVIRLVKKKQKQEKVKELFPNSESQHLEI